MKNFYDQARRDAALCLGLNPAEPPPDLETCIAIAKREFSGVNRERVVASVYSVFARQFDRAMKDASK